MTNLAQQLATIIRKRYGGSEQLALHEPVFFGNEKNYVLDAIESSYVSSVGPYVNRLEAEIAQLTQSKYAVATVNGTAGLHLALVVAGVEVGHEVLVQPLSFVATCNAISYCGARPHFIDVDPKTLGLSADALEERINAIGEMREGKLYNKETQKRISACIAMHTFGFGCEVDRIAEICMRYNLPFVEDAAEAVGTYINGRHAGTFGQMGVFSFNGNKIVTAGGGGCVITNDEGLAKKLNHLSTTAKVPHPYAYDHDQVGYNYRLPNLNAALLVAQLESLPKILKNKRETALYYRSEIEPIAGMKLLWETPNTQANFWLNTLFLDSKKEQEKLLNVLHTSGIYARPIWRNLDALLAFQSSPSGDLEHAHDLVERIINIPSSFVSESNL